MAILKQVQSVILSIALALSAVGAAGAGTVEPQNPQGAPPSHDLQQIVAPIALYPDALIAQILAGATYPTQVVEANQWLQQNKNLQGDQLAAAVDQQPWDPSIKALSQLPSVLENMNKNLSWTSALGDAYVNDPNGVMNTIQMLRKDARNAGNLNTTPEQTVSTEGDTIAIAPSNPEVVYVPEYSPADIYGVPIEAYPGYSGWDVVGASAISFGVGMTMGAVANRGWGWGAWGTNWHGGNVEFNRNTYVSRSNTFANRNASINNASRTNIDRNVGNRSINQGNAAITRSKPAMEQPRAPSTQNFGDTRGFGSADRAAGSRSNGAFSGFDQGGAARMNSSRGSASFGGAGGGGSRGGGGGFRGGGGGRRR